MIFKPKISHQKPIKPPLKADFNAYFTQKRMIFTPIYKICATPKGPFRVRFPAGVPRRRKAAMSAASSLAAWPKGLRLLFPHICCASVREPYFSRALWISFVWFSVRKRTRGSPHCAAMAQKAKRWQFPMRRGMFKPRRGWRRWAPFSPPSRRERRSPQRR